MKRVLNNNMISIIKTRVLNHEELINYINDVIKELELEKYIENIIITKLDNNMGAYNSDEKSLKINYENIIYYAEYAFNRTNLNASKEMFINLYLLTVVSHELTHVIQLVDKDSKYYELFQNESYYSAKNYNTYLKYHDNFAFEREARINALENILLLIKDNNLGDSIFDYYFDTMSKYLIDGYSIFNSPAKKIKKLFNNKINISNLDLYDKLKYGFNIKISEYNKYNKDKINIIIKKLANS